MPGDDKPVRRIRFRQSGGFAGLIRGIEIALDHLDPPDRTRLEALIRGSGLGDTSSARRSAQASKARDAEEIEIEIEGEGGVTRHALSELDLPDEAAPLVDWLKKRARPVKP